MRRYILIFFALFLSAQLFPQFSSDFIEQCSANSGKDATYLKDFQVILEAAQPSQLPPVARYPLVLSKNNIYRFSICTAEGSNGKAILQLYDSNKLIFSSYNKDTGEEYNPFNFMCQKTGIYHVFISFQEGKEGQAVGILSYVTK
ncbi:MAG: hypothetical protein AMS27_00095 [Bacteroides sp. SM23_62_1]|nr:MAG: hypothetical protein AMS27_00095 [Bacteroides sp. SM23_62_1]